MANINRAIIYDIVNNIVNIAVNGIPVLISNIIAIKSSRMHCLRTANIDDIHQYGSLHASYI